MAEVRRVIRVLIVDDHVIVAQGLQRLLETDPRLRVVGCAATMAEAHVLAGQTLPDVIVLDRRMPGGSSVPHIGALRELAGGPRVVVLTGSGPAHKAEALQGGADEFLGKENAADRILETVLRLGGAVGGALVKALTAREAEVARLVAAGLSNPEIAEALSLSPNTVKSHLRSVMAKLEVTDRVGVALAWRNR